MLTAFGERISGQLSGPEDRYGYVGEWGYQAHENFPFLHVGARYYDHATGRFLQRDPIGIEGALNVYEYVESAPTVFVDPTGFGIIGDIVDVITKVLEDILGTNPPAKVARGPIDVTTRALECAPGVARIKIAVDHRRKTLLDNHDDNINDLMDNYERDHDKHVKPGRGPAG